MSTAIVSCEIQRFLASDKAEVLCVRGKWGVGKTFAWRHDLSEAARLGTLAKQEYAYVSLFGLNSLDELRYAIFENTVPAANALTGPTPETFTDRVKEGLKHRRKAASWFAPVLSAAGLGELGNAVARSAFLLVRNQLICIDDMERVGDGLRPKDVLGMISFLREQRNCRVAILLNDEAMSEPDRADFNRLLEKVVDVSLVYDPSPAEALNIAINGDDEISVQLRKSLGLLGVTNIRVIQKIRGLAAKVDDLLKAFRPEIRNQATIACAIGGWSVLEPDTAPRFSFIYQYNSLLHDIRGRRNGEEPEFAKWRDVLNRLGFTGAHDFDRIIFDGVTVGYFDEVRLSAEASSLEKELNRSTSVSSFSDAWRRYRSSLSQNDGEILNGIHDAAHECLKDISPSDVNATATLLKRHGMVEQADGLIHAYVTSKGDDPKFFDLSRYIFAGADDVDPVLRDAFEQKRNSYVDPRDPKKVLLELANRNGWNDEDVRLLAGVSAARYEEIFESIESEDLAQIVQMALRMAGQQDGQSLAMRGALHEALSRIAAKSPLRAERLEAWGFTPAAD